MLSKRSCTPSGAPLAFFLTNLLFVLLSHSSQLGNSLVAQTPLADSLRQAVAFAKADTHKVNLLNDLAWELKFDAPEEARSISQQAIELSRKLDFPKGIGNAHNQLGVIATIHGELDQAIEQYEASMAVRSQIGDQKGVANLHNNIANLLESKGDLIGALDRYQQALRLRAEIGDSLKMVRTYYNLGVLYSNLGNYSEALDYAFRYLESSVKSDDLDGQANAWNVIGNIKFELDQPEEALEHYEKSLTLHRQLDNQWEIASVLNNLGLILDELAENSMDNGLTNGQLDTFQLAIDRLDEALRLRTADEYAEGVAEVLNNLGIVRKNLGSYYEEQGSFAQAKTEWNQALEHLQRSLSIRQDLEDQLGIVEVYNGLGDVYRRLGDIDQALFYTQSYFQLAEQIGAQRYLVNGHKDLARIYAKKGQYDRAYEQRKAYDKLRYQILNEQRAKENLNREVLYSDRQKQWQSEKELLLRDAQLERAALLRNSLLAGALGLGLLVFLLFNRNRIKTRANQALQEKNEIIDEERRRSDELLLNILPAATAQELKEKGRAEARYHESVTVLFTDFKSFTKVAEQLTAAELVAELDRYFRAFDEITARHGVEKIKTIGDAYMCVGGLPLPLENHAQKVIAAAEEIVAAMEGFNADQRAQGKPEFAIRIGVHTGPVVSGIVGNRKFAYDIWGDTVNIAARMESSGEPGRINISDATYQAIKEDYQCTYRGELAAKNKGALKMYFVEGKK